MMRTALTILGFALALALGGCLPPPETPAGRQWIAAVGNLNNLDVIVSARTRGAEGFQYWQRDARGIWRPGVGQGEAAAFVAWREQLVVFFSSGRYGLFGPGSPVVQQSPVPSWAPVAACEDGPALDVFGWNTTGGEPVHARYEDGKWSWPRVEVVMERDKVLDPCAVRFAGRLFLIWREEMPTLAEKAAGYGLRFAYLDKGKWTGPLKSRLRVASPPRVAADGGVLACLYQKPAGDAGAGRWSLATYATTDEDWHESGEVAGAIPAGPAALGRQGNRFFMAVLAVGGAVVAPLEMPAGPREPPRVGEFAPLASAEASPQASENIAFLASVVALALLLAVLSWQRARIGAGAPPASPAPPALVPASIGRRGAAVAIDYMLAISVLSPVLQMMWPGLLPASDPAELMDRMFQGDPQLTADMFIVYGIYMTLIILYTALLERYGGRTLGKYFLGIEVRSVDGGGPITWRQAVLRNALRVVDQIPGIFYVVGVISIIVGPKPQRLGDRLAGTMVVMRPSGDSQPPQ